MQLTLKIHFPLPQDEVSLRLAIESVCTEFGAIRMLRVLPAGRSAPGRPLQCVCFLELDPENGHAELISEYGAFAFGSGVSFVVDVDEGWTGSSSQRRESGDMYR